MGHAGLSRSFVFVVLQRPPDGSDAESTTPHALPTRCLAQLCPHCEQCELGASIRRGDKLPACAEEPQAALCAGLPTAHSRRPKVSNESNELPSPGRPAVEAVARSGDLATTETQNRDRLSRMLKAASDAIVTVTSRHDFFLLGSHQPAKTIAVRTGRLEERLQAVGASSPICEGCSSDVQACRRCHESSHNADATAACREHSTTECTPHGSDGDTAAEQRQTHVL